MPKKYKHDCDCCAYLGRYDDETVRYDLYFCPKGGPGPTVIARFGNEGSQYSSGIDFGSLVMKGEKPVGLDGQPAEWSPTSIALYVALRRAINRSLVHLFKFSAKGPEVEPKTAEFWALDRINALARFDEILKRRDSRGVEYSFEDITPKFPITAFCPDCKKDWKVSTYMSFYPTAKNYYGTVKKLCPSCRNNELERRSGIPTIEATRKEESDEDDPMWDQLTRENP